MRKPLVAVELQLCGDLLLFSAYCKTDGIQHEVHRLLCSSLVDHNAVVVQIPDHGQVQLTLLCLNVGDIGHPFAVRCFGMKISVDNISVFMQLLPHLLPAPAAPDFVSLFCNNISGHRTFSWLSFRSRKDSEFQFCLFALIPVDPILDF